MNINDFNSDHFGEDSESSSWKDSVSLEKFKIKNEGDINDMMESEDENVSEDESSDSHTQSPWRYNQ